MRKKNHIDKIITKFVFLLLLSSVILVFSPISSAGLLRVNSYIDVAWTLDEDPIVPRDEVRILNLTVNYQANKAGDLGAGIIDAYGNKNALIKMEVVDSSPWCTANLRSDTVPLPISSKMQKGTNQLNIQIKEDAPAYGLGFVRIKASVGQLGWLSPYSNEFELNFQPAYLPIINTELPKGNSEKIDPFQSAVFPIEIENMGNARTKVFLEVVSITDGWTAAVTDDVTLDEVEGSESTAYITIKPSKRIGYHDDKGIVRVSLTPARAEDINDLGETSYVTFIVQSKGISTPGFEVILFVCALLVVVMISKKRLKANN